jgi:hypothetical protein
VHTKSATSLPFPIPKPNMTPPLRPLTKDQWVLGLSNYHKSPSPTLRQERTDDFPSPPHPHLQKDVWEAVFDKLVKHNVFQAHWTENGKYNLMVSLGDCDLEKVIGKIREGLVLKGLEGLSL